MTRWSLVEHQAADGVYLVRARDLPAAAERARWPHALWLSWSFGDPADEEGDLAAMAAFEQAADAAAETGGWGMLIAVVTGGVAREWLFHAADSAEFIGELRALIGARPWPVTTRAFVDPNWTAARELSPPLH